jgi:GDP/UDP-N,N'-diacetylbacillosamine 2-epimerase (hydrolysing)
MHLLPSHGLTATEIEKDGFTITDPLYMALDGYNNFTMAKSLGVALMSFVDILMREKPDWMILAGDRGEQLMGAVAGSYTYTAVAHIQAGELSGNIDGIARHAIGKLVHLHFASNQDAGQRLIKLGEEPHRVKVVGAPQLDELVQRKFTSKEKLKDHYDLDLDEPYLLVIQHPVTEEYDQAEAQIQAMVAAVNRFDMLKIWILPNNDAGSEFIRQGILRGRSSQTQIFKNLPRGHYLGLMKHCACMVGNSSSGLLEAPTFMVPAINIGRRQENRVAGVNVINVTEFDVSKITQGIKKGLSPGFKKSLEGMENPYGDGRSSERILDILTNTPKDTRLLVKNLTY